MRLILQILRNLRSSEMPFQGPLIDGATVFSRRKMSQKLGPKQTPVCEQSLTNFFKVGAQGQRVCH